MGNANASSRNPKGDPRCFDGATHIDGSGSQGRPSSSGAGAAGLHEDANRLSLTPLGYGETMLQSPPDSPSSVSRSPLMFTPQIPMVPIARGDEFSLGPFHGANMYERRDFGLVQQERGMPTMIVWSHGGSHVGVEGSWDDWSTKQPMQKVGKDFTIVKMLPSGVYQYNFIVDKDWHYPADVLASLQNNVLDVQDYVPENLDSVAGFEPPGSPSSSYNDTFPTPEDFSKDPPGLPSHLHLTLLNVPPSEESFGNLPRPQHVTLSHLYVEKGKNLKSVLALGTTHRYRSKYITVALYKPINK